MNFTPQIATNFHMCANTITRLKELLRMQHHIDTKQRLDQAKEIFDSKIKRKQVLKFSSWIPHLVHI
jgi:hypothetical protein